MVDQSPADTQVGSYIGNYRVIRTLGQGAMGTVLLGEHPRIGRKVAIKLLHREHSERPTISERFVAEARAVNAIQHPNIIQIYDFGNLPDGRLYFVMEYIEGEELRALLDREAPLALPVVAELLAQIAAGLDAAHDQDIVHRDLKPENLYLARTAAGRQVKILDFGIAKLRSEALGPAARTAVGMIMGTPLYMSPEQAAGRVDAITAASDVYSLGIILYEMLTRSAPYAARTTAELLTAHITTAPRPIRTLRPDLPEAVSFCIDQCLAKEPSQRPARASVVLEMFRQGLGTAVAVGATGTPADIGTDETIAHVDRLRPAGAAPPELAPPVARPPGAAPALPGQPPGPARPVAPPARSTTETLAPLPRPRAQLVLLALTGALVVAGLVFLLLRGTGGKPAPAPAPPPSPDAAVTRTVAPDAATTNQAMVSIRSVPEAAEAELGLPGGERRLVKLPHRLSAAHGDRLVVTARAPGFEPETESFIVLGPRELVIKLTPKAAEPMTVKPPPRPREPPPRVDPPRRPPPREVMEGTLTPPRWD